MFGGTLFGVGAMEKNTLHVFVVEQSRTINELVQHPCGQEVLGGVGGFAHGAWNRGTRIATDSGWMVPSDE
jgi:hypothetical protein